MGRRSPVVDLIGHASFLGSLGGRPFLIDPVFSDHAGSLPEIPAAA
jgi:L-ascorbate metabolism protein UlaG (beta-lactamase superfamily)